MTDEQNNKIIADFKVNDHISFVNSSTGSENTYVTVGDSFTLSKGIIYRIPISNKELDLANFHIVKDTPQFAGKLLIRYVSEGYVTVYSLMNGVIIKTGDVLGTTI